ncbi:MAG: hypothetical protein ABIR16_08505, partial [Dokdonella sp.]
SPTERIARSQIGEFTQSPKYLAREAKLKMDRNAGNSTGVTLLAVEGRLYAPLNESGIAAMAILRWPSAIIGTYTRRAAIADIAEDIESILVAA